MTNSYEHRNEEIVGYAKGLSHAFMIEPVQKIPKVSNVANQDLVQFLYAMQQNISVPGRENPKFDNQIVTR